jgi:rhodanese-related sulfurtransferase
MDWLIAVAALGVVGLFLGATQLGRIRANLAREHLRKGAKVIDVRGPSEFQRAHLEGAVNVPLGELRQRISQAVPDKRTVLLLHCHSGGRSAIGTRILKNLGYERVFNLGSYGRAERIVRGK